MSALFGKKHGVMVNSGSPALEEGEKRMRRRSRKRRMMMMRRNRRMRRKKGNPSRTRRSCFVFFLVEHTQYTKPTLRITE